MYIILALVMRNDPYTDAKYYAFDEEEIVLEDEIIIKEVKD